MPPPQHRVDVGALHSALWVEKNERGMSWRQLAHECNLSPSTFTRMANGQRPDVDAFAVLVRWLGQPAETFITAGSEDPRPAPDLVDSLAPLLRARKDLTEDDVQDLQALFAAAVAEFRSTRARS